jgi:hypothetical protein
MNTPKLKSRKELTMNSYTIALFLHVVGALAFFVALGLEWTSLRHLQRASTVDQVREWMQVPNEMGRLGMMAMVTLLTAGIYMMLTAWGAVPWLIVTFVAIILLVILTAALTGPRMAAIRRTLDHEEGPISHSLQGLLNDSRLRISIQTRTAIATGIVFLMTVKPDFVVSLLTIFVTAILGLVSALRMPSAKQSPEVTAK